MPSRVPISFKSALARFAAECSEIAPKVGELDAADRAHLARWADDDRAERIWQKVQKLAWGPVGSYEPLDGFVVIALAARRLAESAEFFDELVEREKKRRARHLERAVQLDALAKIWRDNAAIDHPKAVLALDRAKLYEEEAQVWRRLALKPIGTKPFLVSRVNKSGSRRQRAFMELVGKRLRDLCGRFLDSEVATLNDIAFDTAEPTSPFQARSARRPTTRGTRSPGKQKKLRQKP